MRGGMRSKPSWKLTILSAAALAGAGACGGVSPPAATPDELSRGLVVLYPGGSSEPMEMIFWYAGLREAGIDQAIELSAWGTPGDALKNATDFGAVQASAAREAVRLAKYMDEH